MFSKKLVLSIVMVFSIAGQAALAKHFELKELAQAKDPMYDMAAVSGKISYYDFVRKTVGPQMQKLAPKSRLDNETELVKGHGVSVKLSENNYNVHVNFPNASTGGRSYGWSSGQVGDWSDAMYLNNLAGIIGGDEDNLSRFYETVIQMVGQCRADLIETLDANSQQVATNFLAIYTAEAYRAMVPDAHPNWDDALLQVTLLGALHGGQKTFTKFYAGEFSTTSLKQDSGVYARGRPGPLARDAKAKKAEMNDYWQFSANPDSKQSGINITRNDFEEMGEMITRYESTVARNPRLNAIFKVVGGERSNVIRAISKFFTSGKSKDVTEIDALAKDVAAFMMDVRADADKITEWQSKRH